ncbi:MAG: pantoate--beta-alanine ligase [bacterium]
MNLKIFRKIDKIKVYLDKIRSKRKTIGLVPTMGALHEGHISLVKRSVKENDVTVVSIFVNPTQFSPNEDYSRYPRKEKEDIKLLTKNNADAVFIPKAAEMYAEKFNTYVEVKDLDKYLCGEGRPSHFKGVSTVVTKLLNIIQPNKAYFGKKDYQQFGIIKKLAEDLNFPVKIIGCATVRDRDGLALSSRNTYLSANQRKSAPLIYEALKNIKFMIKYCNFNSKKDLNRIFRSFINKIPGSRIEYFEIVDRDNFSPVELFKDSMLIAAAVWIKRVRLIDNIELFRK